MHDRFCKSHWDRVAKCAIGGCERAIGKGFRTCDDSVHRGYELERRAQGQAIFRLKRRAERRAAVTMERVSVVVNTSGSDDVLDDAEVVEELDKFTAAESDTVADVLDRADVADTLGTSPRIHHSNTKKSAKKAASQPKMKSAMYRKWTHNEQLMVRCCGIILSRATFYESEGSRNALVSAQQLEPIHPLMRPAAIRPGHFSRAFPPRPPLVSLLRQ